MKAATIIKRIGTMRKEIKRYEREIKYYEKEYMTCEAPHMQNEGRKWIEYYRGMIRKQESKIAEASKEAAKLASKEERDEMIKAMAQDMAERGFEREGYTTNGLKYSIYGNSGWTERSRHCWSMNIEGHGCVFTSGTLETVAEYIINN